MARTISESGFSSMFNEDYDAIESCPCDDEGSRELPRAFPSIPIYSDAWEPIVIYRKDKKKQRKYARCTSHQSRIVQKNGRATDMIHSNVNHRYRRYMRDLSNTMVNGRWRWVTLTLVLTFSGLWLLFGWFWMLIATFHGDMDADHPRNDTCSVGIEGFAGFLLMSIETQTTIGYGSRYPTENCPEGVFMLCLQMIIGIGVEGAVLGMFYVKMTRPRNRDSRKLFSKIAVVCQRDGDLCLIFRASDHDRAHIVGTQVRAYLMEKRHTEQGEHVEAFQRPLTLEPIELLLWPVSVVHRITPSSPLYDVSATDLLLRKFEIIVTMIGSSDSTGQLTQSRTSYLASEIYWGHRFKPCVHYNDEQHVYVVHEEMLSSADPVDTPLCSAQRLEEVLRKFHDEPNAGTITSAVPSLQTDSCSSPASLESSPSPPTVHLEEILETDV